MYFGPKQAVLEPVVEESAVDATQSASSRKFLQSPNGLRTWNLIFCHRAPMIVISLVIVAQKIAPMSLSTMDFILRLSSLSQATRSWICNVSRNF